MDCYQLNQKIRTDFGKVEICLHRLFENDELKDKILIGNFNAVKLKYLIDTNLRNIPTDQTAYIKQFFTEFTIEVKNQDYFSCISGLDNTLCYD
ncbi:MAG: DUF5309 domain-containing protein [Campylobacter sp.]|nr:DUF5309 domain-containing protein [Campylobacter sp.]